MDTDVRLFNSGFIKIKMLVIFIATEEQGPHVNISEKVMSSSAKTEGLSLLNLSP